MLISDKKIRLWMSCAVLRSRAASREVVIAMPPTPVTAYYSNEHARCIPAPPPVFALDGPGWKLDNFVACQAFQRSIGN